MRDSLPVFPTPLLILMVALSGCAVSPGGGLTIGDKAQPVSTPKLVWTSWEDAQRASNIDRKPIVLYVVGKPREGIPEFDAELFDNEQVKTICRDTSCVRMPEAANETVFSNKRGVSVLMPSGELLYQYETAPDKDAFVAAVRRAVLLAQPRRTSEPRQLQNDAKKGK